MEKNKANSLLLFLQERSNFPLTVVVNAIEEQKTPAISISGQNYSLKFKFHKNGKVTVRAKFIGRDSEDSRYWNATIEKTLFITIIKDKKSDDIKKLKVAHTHNSHLISGKDDFLRRYPHLSLPEYYNISNNLSLSEDCGIDLLKIYVTGD